MSTNNGKVTFETKCWECDWEVLLKTDYLQKMIANCNYEFATKRLLINNVKNINLVKQFAALAISNGIIDEYIVVNDYADRALEQLNLTKEQLGKGYYYSISELVGIFCCETEYLVHFSSDTRMEKIWKHNFIRDGIQLFQENPNVAVINPMWNYRFKEIPHPNWDQHRLFHLGNGFSDQCYLIRADEFKQDIYHFEHASGALYPEYGGELFEKRCNAYLRNKQRIRAVHMKSSYWSENIVGLSEYKKSRSFINRIAHNAKYKLF